MRAVSLVTVAALLSLGLLAAEGCVPRRTRVAVSYHGDVVAEVPPEPMVEYIPDAPSTDYVWVPGYWYWSGAGYVWVAGRYATPPSAGHIYVRSGWVVVDGRYRFVRGYWAPSGYTVRHRYVYSRPAPVRAQTYRAVPRGRR